MAYGLGLTPELLARAFPFVSRSAGKARCCRRAPFYAAWRRDRRAVGQPRGQRLDPIVSFRQVCEGNRAHLDFLQPGGRLSRLKLLATGASAMAAQLVAAAAMN